MRYSSIIGDLFYNIGLPSGVADLVDVHFTASAHHLLILSETFSAADRVFHVSRHRAHLREMMSYIFLNGDFKFAKDESGRNLQHRASWNPETNFALPDPRMFNSMSPDPSLTVGESHPSDSYLKFMSLEAETSNNAQTRALAKPARPGSKEQLRRMQ